MPLLERKREILVGQAKGRMEKGRPKAGEAPVNLPEDAKETRDAVAAEIGARARVDHPIPSIDGIGDCPLDLARWQGVTLDRIAGARLHRLDRAKVPP